MAAADSSSKAVVASLDIGTTGVRCVLFDSDSCVVSNEYARISPIHPLPGWSEIDAMELWNQCRTVITQAIQAGGVSARDVSALGIATLRGSFVCWSRSSGRPLHNIVTWQDTRSADICKA